MTVLSQVLVLPSDTANDGQTRLSVPKHSQTSQEVRKTRFDWSQVSSWGLAAGGEALSITQNTVYEGGSAWRESKQETACCLLMPQAMATSKN